MKSLILISIFTTIATSLVLAMPSAPKNPFPIKKGICTKNKRQLKNADGSSTWLVDRFSVGWSYNWGGKISANHPDNVNFAPMLYSVYGKPKIEDVTNRVKKIITPTQQRQKHTVVFGFNEPDHKKQANLTVEKALKYWKSLEGLGVPLCSPGTVHPDNTWMKQFMAGVKKQKLRVDYISIHDYGNGNPEAFKKKLKRIHLAYNKRPLIITEFAVADWNAKSPEKNRHSPEKVLKFMKEILPWMDKQDWIAGYAWFSFGIDTKQGTSSALFDKKGNLTKLGHFYKNHKSK